MQTRAPRLGFPGSEILPKDRVLGNLAQSQGEVQHPQTASPRPSHLPERLPFLPPAETRRNAKTGDSVIINHACGARPHGNPLQLLRISHRSSFARLAAVAEYIYSLDAVKHNLDLLLLRRETISLRLRIKRTTLSNEAPQLAPRKPLGIKPELHLSLAPPRATRLGREEREHLAAQNTGLLQWSPTEPRGASWRSRPKRKGSDGATEGSSPGIQTSKSQHQRTAGLGNRFSDKLWLPCLPFMLEHSCLVGPQSWSRAKDSGQQPLQARQSAWQCFG